MTTFSSQYKTEIFVKCSPQEAHKGFLEHIWIGGGGLGPIPPAIVEQGDPVSRNGCVRRVPGCIHETIYESEVGKKIVYRVSWGPFPVSAHRGTVTFQKKDDGTLVSWQCDYTPYFGFGCIVGLVISTTFGIMLRHMVKKIESRL
eukprot:Hpha_TRINITY_DN16790_c1_g4::TRINITY_DN16790_c1_g4_i1::g.80097::m.80097